LKLDYSLSPTIPLSRKRKSDPRLGVANKRQKPDDEGSGRALVLRSTTSRRKPDDVGAEVTNKRRSDKGSSYSLQSKSKKGQTNPHE
jgi:hypothetical protein